MRERKVDVGDLQIAVAGDSIYWAILPIISPGRTALLLGASQRPFELGEEDLAKLINAACARFADRGVHLVQVLLEPVDQQGMSLFASQGFQRIAELLYLRAPVRPPRGELSLPPGWEWEIYSDHRREEFSETILASYQQSLDCPALNGLRDIQDVIAGHLAGGEFDPRYWFLLRADQRAIGVLLLNRVPRSDMAEVAYLGVIPEARGTGAGTVMMRQAFATARQMKLRSLTLAVDSVNSPALRLYYKNGMQQVGSKIAMFRDMRRENR